MPREGRALELLVARLEAAASAGEADVQSPEFFTGRNSESRREVDVTVRSKVGSTSVLVMFECRDRAGTEDVRWIDEIAGKRDDIGADVAVAVTSGGGSPRALGRQPPATASTYGPSPRSPSTTWSLGTR